MSTFSPGQHKDETPAEYLRRVVANIGHEREGMLDELPSVEAVLDFFGLWSVYGTDFWEGCLECIAGGADAEPALRFIRKHKLGLRWTDEVRAAQAERRAGA